MEAFDVAGVTVPAGDYWFHDVEFRWQRSRNLRFRGDYTVTAGEFYDGTRLGFTANPAWNPSKHLELNGRYEVNRIEFAGRHESTTTQLARLSVQVAFDTRLSFSTFVQYSNVADLTALNARFRFNVREGTDLWIVYNEGLNTRRDVADVPRLPLSAGRTLMIKYSHALIW
jgi:hypothetical protein